MLKSYFTTASRTIKRNRLHSFITVLCLSIGLAASFLAAMFIVDENSFDKFHSNGKNIFRLNKVNIEPNGGTSLTAETSGLMGPTMVAEFPEVKAFVRFMPWFNKVMLMNDDHNVLVKEQGLIFVDSSFFEVFDFKLLTGDPSTALKNPGSIVLTQTIAKNLFGNENPIGKTVRGLQDVDFTVTGIVAEAPRNSHLQFDGLISWTTTVPALGQIPMEFMNNWIAQALTTYIVLNDATDQINVEAKFKKFMADHIPTRVDKYSLYLQPFFDLYLESYNVQGLKMQKTGSKQFNYFFSVIALFILVLACINYININTAKASRRAKEVAMRKTLGANRKQLINQFLSESFVFVIIAACIGVALLFAAIPHFNNLTSKSLAMTTLADKSVLFLLLMILLVVGFSSGLYPAFVLSSFKPAALQRLNRPKSLGNIARQVLIVFQFVITIAIIAGTFLIYQQIKLVLSASTGFDKEHVLVVNLSADAMQQKEVLRNAVEDLPNVESTSTSQTALGMGTFSTYIIPEGFNPNEVESRVFLVDGNFLKTYGLTMAVGRFFVPGSSSDSSAVIINETLLKRLGWADPTKKTIKFDEGQPALPVIGVLKDFNFKSFYEPVEPLVMVISAGNQRNLAIRFSGNPSNIITALEKQWKTVEQRYPFNYMFVDERFAQAYASEENLLTTVLTFAGISILIACLGIYGLVAFTLEQRTKEIGIRKVLGASVAGLNFMMNKNFMIMVLVSAAIAVPLVLPVIEKWTSKFALKMEISPLAFIIAFLLTVLVTTLTVSIQAIRAALANPVKALRSE
jgi:putative ABC transport system permease protein